MRRQHIKRNSSTTKRSKRLGDVCESLTVELLKQKGFTNIRSLNAERMNYPFADVYAERGDQRFVISIKGRNKFENNGNLNARYKLGANCETHAAAAARQFDSQAAWVTLQVDPRAGVFSAYFGTLAGLCGNLGVPMTQKAVESYECLASLAPLPSLGDGITWTTLLNTYEQQPEALDAPIVPPVPQGIRTSSGVFVADDFRRNLIIDRYDREFLTMRGSQRESMRSENSEDTLTWNVFRSLAQIDPAMWLPKLFDRTFQQQIAASTAVSVRLWPRVPAPPTLRLLQGDEGESEIDVLIECDAFVWFVDAKFRSDNSERTTNNPNRDQILRNIDVGSWYAGVRDFYFSLLMRDQRTCRIGNSIVRKYSESPEAVRRQLAHRPDGLRNLKGIGSMLWCDAAAVLTDCAIGAAYDENGAAHGVPWSGFRAKELRQRPVDDG